MATTSKRSQLDTAPKAGKLIDESMKIDKKLPELQTKMLVDNRWVDAVSGKTFATINPATGEKICDVAEAHGEDVERAVQAAKRAFPSWSHKTGVERARLLNKLADLIEQNLDEISALETLDNGKPFATHSKKFDVPLAIKTYRYYAGWADKVMGKTIPVDGPYHAYSLCQPIGVVGAIIPWNFPLVMQAWKLAPALAAGCTVVLKPSDKTPLSALRVGQLFIDAGFPPGVVNIITGHGREIGKALACHKDVSKVAFTGSTAVGRKILKYSAKSNLKKTTLELGGKSPNIVFDDCDFEKTAATSLEGVYMNSGQTCCAGTRLLVQDTIYDKMVNRLGQLAKERTIGNPFDPQTDQGPVIDEEQFNRIMDYIKVGKQEGARLITGGHRVGDRGYFIAPTIFADVNENMRISKEEIFGPVLVIEKFTTIDDAIRLANNTTYGLGGSVFTKDTKKYLKVTQEVEAGIMWVNCYNVLDAALPFGGWKESGVGRELGEEGLRNYLEHKSVCVSLE
jgi:aldehyde dehydrogenase (NAD+)